MTDKNLGDAVVDRKTEPGFTPGPWEIQAIGVGRDIVVTDQTGNAVCSVPNTWVDGFPFDEAVANARLIAAAPSMAVFLMKIYLDYESDCGCECNSETCCAVVGEPCAKCHANVALLLLDQPDSNSDLDVTQSLAMRR